MNGDVAMRIILQDDSLTAEQVASASRREASSGQRTPGPSDRVTGPKKRSDEPITPLEGGIKAAELIGRALGMGGLVSTVKALADSFSELFRAVNRSTTAHETHAKAVQSTTQARGADIVGPKKPTGPEVIDADWEFKSPKPGLVPAGPSPTDRMGSRGGALIKAPQPLSARHATTRVETIGVTSGVSAATRAATAAATAGPAAGASAGMAALTAATGPLAVAFATTTAAVIAGGVAVKKLADIMHSEARRLAEISGPLAHATAINEIRSEFADLRRAQRIGPDLARFEERLGRGGEAAAEFQTKVLSSLLKLEEKFGPLTEALIQSVNLANKHYPAIEDGVKQGFAASYPITKAIMDTVLAIAKLGRADVEEKEDFDDPFMAAFLGAALAKAAGGAAPGRRPAAVRPERGPWFLRGIVGGPGDK